MKNKVCISLQVKNINSDGSPTTTITLFDSVRKMMSPFKFDQNTGGYIGKDFSITSTLKNVTYADLIGCIATGPLLDLSSIMISLVSDNTKLLDEIRFRLVRFDIDGSEQQRIYHFKRDPNQYKCNIIQCYFDHPFEIDEKSSIIIDTPLNAGDSFFINLFIQ